MGRVSETRSIMLVVLFFTVSSATQADEPRIATIDIAKPLLNAVRTSKPAPSEIMREEPIVNAGDQETIHERYPNRRVKISREVIQDDQGNYVNHGEWKFWDSHGKLVAQGRYHFGKRHGDWSRGHRREDSELFATAPFNQFQPPFISKATFEHGKLNGPWIIQDVKSNVVCQWVFSEGTREGKSVWKYPNGQEMRSIDYRDGVIQSQQLFKADGSMVGEHSYDNGRRLGVKSTQFKDSQQIQTEGGYLSPRIVQKTSDDWWNAKPATYASEGKEMKHGPWKSYHPNSQLAQMGRFEYGAPVGKFTWWYSNGQKALEGDYENGQPTDRWVWWHANGQKKTDGRYTAGAPAGPWSWWKTDGKLTHRADFSDDASKVVTRSSTRRNTTEARKPVPPTPNPVKRR